ncbi:TetR/AcrR family transcriptional regulator [Longirhabdus pacifica]|uniref:TetR/AcrR family transcriptional regulator n=1 Tax=Longirhabdus pacifica TaxID=2305227 RepID=UPI0010092A20|nr:TetR/AcrR family transcriptional regulator [Longirhabdus pacifica]
MSPKVSEAHKEQRRADILQAAEKVFAEHGYEKTTMKHIMDEANVSRGGLYLYFSSKEDVFETLLEEDILSYQEKMRKHLQSETNNTSYWHTLLTTLYGNEKHENMAIGPASSTILEFFITGRNDEERRSYGKKRYTLAIQMYIDIIEKGKESGEFSQEAQSDMIARSIVAFTDGVFLDYTIVGNEDVKMNEQIKYFTHYLAFALGVKQT